MPVGGVIASIGFPCLLPVIGWRPILACTALACIAMMMMLSGHQTRANIKAGKPTGFLAGFLMEQKLVWRNTPLRVLAILGLLYSSLQLSISAFTVSMLVDHGWTLLGAGLAAGAVQACGAIGRISWGAIGHRLGGFKVLSLIGALATLCMLALWGIDALPDWALIALLCLFGFCMTGWNGVLLAEATRHCRPDEAGRVIGGVLVYTFVGVMAGPSLLALIYSACGDYAVTFCLVSWIAGIGAVAAGKAARAAGSASIGTPIAG